MSSSRAYYNEIDPNAAEWLRQLIKLGQIAPGDVDERSIEDVTPVELRPYRQCHFFAGIGTWSYALRQAGWPDDRPVFTGSAPCQPFSTAGQGAGIDDERHLWPSMLWLIQQCRPPVVFGEQVASKDALRWWDIVAADLENQDYACTAVDLCAAGCGAPHIRQRLFWVAYSECAEWRQNSARDERNRPDAGWDEATSWLGARSKAGANGKGIVGNTSIDRGHNRGGVPRRCDQEVTGDEAPIRSQLWSQAEGASVAPSASGADPGILGDSSQSRLQGGGAGFLRSPQESSERNPPQRASDVPFWHDAEWLPCSDGKARPAKPGTFPLVDGVAPDLVCSGDSGPSGAKAIQTENTAEARVMRLKGYGNGIVAPLAIDFISATQEVLHAL